MTYAVTGAAGYLGSRITKGLRARGARVIALSRRPAPGQPDTARFVLGDRGPIAGLEQADALVHCAYDFSIRGAGKLHAVNVVGSQRLFDAARQAGVRHIVLISTISAFPGCRSKYGQTKLAIEAAVSERGGQVVRPGLVFGPNPGGMLGRLAKATRSLPMLAVPKGGNQNLYMAHEDDVTEVVYRLVERAPGTRSPVTAAGARPWLLRELFAELGRTAGRTPVIVPVPWQLMYAGLRTIEAARLPSPLGSDSVVSIVNQNPAPSFAEAASLGVSFREFTAESLD